jgi:putative ABC transport system substrate-binding protein
MRRRNFFELLGDAAVVWPLSAYAEQSKVWRVGYLNSGPLQTLDSFRQRMADLGYVEGRNLVADVRSAERE